MNIRERNIKYIELEDDFIIEIVSHTPFGKRTTEFWIYNKYYGIKEFAFGLPGNLRKEKILDLVEFNKANYILEYKRKYMKSKRFKINSKPI